MTRQRMTRQSLVLILLCLAASCFAPAQEPPTPAEQPFAAAQEPLPGTEPLTWEGDLSMRLMEGAHVFVERKIDDAPRTRPNYWQRDLSSPEAYVRSVAPNREHFRSIIGLGPGGGWPAAPSRDALRDNPAGRPVFETYGDDDNPALVAETDAYRVYQVRWPVLEGVWGEGLLLRPRTAPKACIVALPDADQTPEQAVGLAPGVPAASQFARRLAENGFEVVVPVLIDRSQRWSGSDEFGYTPQTHREWIYRQAYQMGRHIIGYEVEKISAAIDVFAAQNRGSLSDGRGQNATAAEPPKIGVAGYAEGGLLALYAAAADPRIDAALVSAYFDSRQRVWSEPIYRNVWGLLKEFGDAEIASLIAPRGLVVEYAEAPQITGQKGDWHTPGITTVRFEFNRIATFLEKQHLSLSLSLNAAAGGGPSPTNVATSQTSIAVTMPHELIQPVGGSPGSEDAVRAFTRMLGDDAPLPLSAAVPSDQRRSFDPGARQKRQLKQLETHVQSLVRQAERVRQKRFLETVMPQAADHTWTMRLDHGTLPVAPFVEASKKYRREFRDEILGQFDDPLLPPNARTRQIYDREKWTGYEVVLDVWPDVIAWGVLLVPKDIAPGERRPVVVCQHGRRGVPRDVIEGDSPYYHDFAARLADQGFITFAPHNLYRGEDRYRWLDRKANSVKASMFSFILAQHQQILHWLGTLPFVDASRIGFYGLSYGGETAVRVPPLLEGYALSICSGDFNSWTRKVAATDEGFSFMYSIEWEMPYFNMGPTFDYAELAYLMVPRPFMVERGHHDQVGRDQWVAHEYAKVRWLYDQLGLDDKTTIEYFNGGHTIHGEGTFEFLKKQLRWPESGNTP